jgi:hypothetical protein
MPWKQETIVSEEYLMENTSAKRWRLIASLAVIAAACIAVIVLFPILAQRLFPRMGIPGQESSPPGLGGVLISDDFSSPLWSTGTNTDSSVEYANNALQMIVHPKNTFVWSPLNDQDYQNIHLEVTVINNATDSTTAFGLICNQQAENFYYFAITPAGQYAIAKAAEGQDDLFLTNDDQWTNSDLIPTDASSYRVGADCGNGTLTLYVDGQQIDSVSDASYTTGGVALFTWSGEEATNTNVSFDDFLMTQLP